MFSKKNNSAAVSETSAAPSGANNSIVRGTSLEGTVNAGSDIRVDGSLKGTLICKGRVIIGPEGVIEGDIDCQNAIIEGRFTGKLKVADLLNVKENAHIDGEVTTGKILIQAGAVFNGTCSMGGQRVKSNDQEALSFKK